MHTSCFGQMRIESCQSPLSGKLAVPDMGLGQPSPGEREGGVELHRPLKFGQRFVRALFRIAIRIKPAL